MLLTVGGATKVVDAASVLSLGVIEGTAAADTGTDPVKANTSDNFQTHAVSILVSWRRRRLHCW